MKKQLTREELLTLLEEHSDEVAAVIFKHVQSETVTFCADERNPIMQLPVEVREMIIHREAFNRAFLKGFLEFGDNGIIVSKFSPKCMLAYFCGRVFCDDTSRKTRGYSYWKKGDTPFPEKLISELFGIDYLRELRNKYANNKKIFKGYQIVDSLFFVDDKRYLRWNLRYQKAVSRHNNNSRSNEQKNTDKI